MVPTRPHGMGAGRERRIASRPARMVALALSAHAGACASLVDFDGYRPGGAGPDGGGAGAGGVAGSGGGAGVGGAAGAGGAGGAAGAGGAGAVGGAGGGAAGAGGAGGADAGVTTARVVIAAAEDDGMWMQPVTGPSEHSRYPNFPYLYVSGDEDQQSTGFRFVTGLTQSAVVVEARLEISVTAGDHLPGDTLSVAVFEDVAFAPFQELAGAGPDARGPTGPAVGGWLAGTPGRSTSPDFAARLQPLVTAPGFAGVIGLRVRAEVMPNRWLELADHTSPQGAAAALVLSYR